MTAYDILQLYKDVSPDIIETLTASLLEEFKTKYPEVDWSDEKNIDFLIRPIVASILTGEIVKDINIATSSIDAIVNSALNDELKYELLKKYAVNLGFTPISNSWQLLYKEIIEYVKNNWYNLKLPLSNFIFSKYKEINNIYIADMNSKELRRHILPITQFPDYMINNFQKNETNERTITGSAFSRKDIEQYYKAHYSGFVKLPNFLDVYLSTEIETGEMEIKKADDGFYYLPNNYWIDIKHLSKEFNISVDEQDFYFGIIKRPLKIYVVDGDDLEVFTYHKYNIPDIDLIQDLINVSNVLLKGFFVVFANLKVLTEADLDLAQKEAIGNEIYNYFKHKKYFSQNIDIREINSILSSFPKCILSTKISGELILAPGIKKNIEVNFPINASDFNIDTSFDIKQLSNNNLLIYPQKVEIVNES